jgi:carbon monoxide dehydrogenase subunit G
MSAYHHQAYLHAPLDEVWALVGDPSRYPQWWPRVIEVRGERFEEGDEYAQVTRNPIGQVQSSFLIDQRDELREIRMTCQLTGAYADWTLTEAQDGTFVNLEMGMQPRRLGDRLMDAAVGRRYFRRWSQESLKALEGAAQRKPDAAAR